MAGVLCGWEEEQNVHVHLCAETHRVHVYTLRGRLGVPRPRAQAHLCLNFPTCMGGEP